MRKYLFMLFAVLLFNLPTLAQTKPAQAPPVQAAKPAADPPPVLSDKNAKDIAIHERNLVQEQAQMADLSQKYNDLADKMKADNAELQKEIAAAQIPGWSLNLDTLIYSKVPEPQKTADKKPAVKK